MGRGVNGCSIFADDEDRMTFLAALSRISLEMSCQVIAYCLMGNHFHLAIRVGRIPLSAIMHRLLLPHAARFNRRHDRTGHLFQDRYEASLCLDDKYLSTLIPYIHMNPVRAGFVARPQDWPWSTYAGEKINPVDLLDFDPWPNATKERIALTRQAEEETISLNSLTEGVVRRSGFSLEDMRSSSRLPRLVEARRTLAREAIRQGHSQAAVAKWILSTRSSVSRYVRETFTTTGVLVPDQRRP